MTRQLDMQATSADQTNRLSGIEHLTKPKAKESVSPILIVGALFVIAFTAAMLLKAAKPVSLASRMPDAPEVLAEPLTCQLQGSAALSRGGEVELAALAKAERFAFDVHDGVSAVQLYGLAASCYTQGGDATSATRARKAEEAWRARMKSEYQSHRLRLRLALDRGATNDAYREANGISTMLRGTTGPYVEWLAAIERAYKPVEKKRNKYSARKDR